MSCAYLKENWRMPLKNSRKLPKGYHGLQRAKFVKTLCPYNQRVEFYVFVDRNSVVYCGDEEPAITMPGMNYFEMFLHHSTVSELYKGSCRTSFKKLKKDDPKLVTFIKEW